MKILRYVHYLYLVMAILFLYEGIVKMQQDENPIVVFLFAAVAIFMFFFRRHFSNKIQK
ncbi:hypothetical protein FCR2A7T_01110 [Flavobacterium cauense R2A-7]|uniref:LPXTG-motif cell wall-anchored protein n=1 Tax=Flavobacterium cauense R2A-7 TaxID=1341154 RepID=V6S5Z2_9FLAO|nr:hypothetical protein [Flavobacterium cauense]ESU21657.1 hypothetical protein FCR2A7T_01110 [Flavobacterium cauense R2A-7]TWI10405.1 hypothetical protein IP98_02215 [Flavobacterium cauense R2A-7]